VVAQGRIELPTQGFSDPARPLKTIGFQLTTLPNKIVAHDLCRKINVLRSAVKTLSTDCDSAAEFAQACFCCSHFFSLSKKLLTLLQSATFSQRSRALA